MLKILLVFAFFSLCAEAQQILDDPKPNLPESLVLNDENATDRRLSEFAGHPFLLVPVFAKCTSSCPLIIETLEHNLALSGLALDSYRVVLFSFDPNDTADDLKMLREMHNIPPAWIITRAERASTEALMSAMGVRAVTDPVTHQFAHPDLVLVIGENLIYSQRLMRSELSPEKLFSAVTGANRDTGFNLKVWLSYLLPVGIFGILLCVFIFVHLMRSRLDAKAP